MAEFFHWLFTLNPTTGWPEWLAYDFQRNAFAALLLMAPLAGLLGVNVLTLRMGFFSDAVAHSAIVGVAVGFMLAAALPAGEAGDYHTYARWSLLLTAAAVAPLVLFIHRKASLAKDTTIAVVMAGAVSVGLILVHQLGRQELLSQFFWGDVLLIDPHEDLPVLAVLLGLGVGFSLLTYNRGLMVGLSRTMAEAGGVRADRFELLFSILLAVSVASMIRLVGLLVVTAMLIVPAATGRNLARSAGGLLRWSVLVAVVSGALGLIASGYSGKWPTGATVVLASCLLFALSLPLAGRHKRVN